jgi:hypothetical protein
MQPKYKKKEGRREKKHCEWACFASREVFEKESFSIKKNKQSRASENEKMNFFRRKLKAFVYLKHILDFCLNLILLLATFGDFPHQLVN